MKLQTGGGGVDVNRNTVGGVGRGSSGRCLWQWLGGVSPYDRSGTPHYAGFNTCSEFFRSHDLLDWTTLILSGNKTNKKKTATCHFEDITFAYKDTPSSPLPLHPRIHHPSRRLPTQPSLSLWILPVSKKNTHPFIFSCGGHDTAVDSTFVPGTNILYVLLYQVQIICTIFQNSLVHFLYCNQKIHRQ